MKTLLLGCAAAALVLAAPAAGADPARLADTVRTLTADAFGGRAPGTPGEDKTVAWLIAQLQALGLEPGGRDGSWTQAVPLVRTRIGAGGTVTVAGADGAVPLLPGRDIYVTTARPVDRVAIADAPLLFVGYGVTAPEQGWDDFKGADLTGKIAVFLVNDPDFEAGAADAATGKFGGRRMTYYGRWTYKFEEAARRGAVGALIVHDTPGAGYGWDTVKAPGGEVYDLVQRDPAARVMLQGWLEGAAATALFRRAGLDLAALRVRARQADFRPVPLAGLAFSAALPVSHATVASRNVLARLPGAARPDELVMVAAHWDAFGIGAPDAQGRTIRAGANDDALGVAGVLEVARAAVAAPRPARSLVFALWTAEENGLLGSQAYAADPVYPLDRTVANFTLDVFQTAGPARDVMLIGKGQNQLEEDLAIAAAAQGRTVSAEALPERGLFYRADHFPLARKGVPTLLMMALGGPPDLVDGGRAAGEAWLKSYMACYHQTCDSLDASWNLRGAADDIALITKLSTDLANSTRWPQWYPGSEFKAAGDSLRR
ncbi:M28 family metallopeptidase [Sphingomonas flavalba]|uniref:M28 family metallopeptidase n=1 Tax=Sphingomonas flavalba TaxID=2559804 RepID=UPI00109E1D48|nr:M28 family metallopeptidase [Sphingomonas flavalba]